MAAEGGWDVPPLDAPLDGVARLDARFSKATAGRSPPTVPDGVPAGLGARMEARAAWIAEDWAGVLAAWARQPLSAQGPLDHLILGEALAEQGDVGALVHAAALEALFPTEAALIRAQLAAQSGSLEATGLLRAALLLAQGDPWVHPRTLKRGLRLALVLGEADRASAEVLLPVLIVRFAEGNVDTSRQVAALNLASKADFTKWCGPALRELEPHVPWDLGVLRGRVRCYERTGNPRLVAAQADLARLEAMSARGR
jgi:hypothetical protein